jgi:hypothetical protein
MRWMTVSVHEWGGLLGIVRPMVPLWSDCRPGHSHAVCVCWITLVLLCFKIAWLHSGMHGLGIGSSNVETARASRWGWPISVSVFRERVFCWRSAWNISWYRIRQIVVTLLCRRYVARARVEFAASGAALLTVVSPCGTDTAQLLSASHLGNLPGSAPDFDVMVWTQSSICRRARQPDKTKVDGNRETNFLIA